MIKSLLLNLVVSGCLMGQFRPSPIPPAIPFPLPGPFETLPEQMTDVQLAEAHRAAVEFELRKTAERLNAFAAAWNAFTVEYTEKRAVNRRKARAVQQAWSRIENLFAH